VNILYKQERAADKERSYNVKLWGGTNIEKTSSVTILLYRASDFDRHKWKGTIKMDLRHGT
jgi:hypothetical protein